ncbi:MAG TPA: hypothetical protein VKV31_00620 [bacterium]|nr:hypothetical protein [bacterium]
MRTFERLLVAAVCIALAVYAASYAYLAHPTPHYTPDIGALFPPRVGMQVYTGETLNVTQSLLIIRVVTGLTHTVNLRTQFIIASGIGSPTGLTSCLYTQHKTQLLIGPCYSQSSVETNASQIVIFTLYEPLFNITKILAGYYNVVYTKPDTLGYYCSQQASLYANSTLILHSASNTCILIQLIQADYSYYPRV